MVGFGNRPISVFSDFMCETTPGDVCVAPTHVYDLSVEMFQERGAGFFGNIPHSSKLCNLEIGLGKDPHFQRHSG